MGVMKGHGRVVTMLAVNQRVPTVIIVVRLIAVDVIIRVLPARLAARGVVAVEAAVDAAAIPFSVKDVKEMNANRYVIPINVKPATDTDRAYPPVSQVQCVVTTVLVPNHVKQ